MALLLCHTCCQTRLFRFRNIYVNFHWVFLLNDSLHYVSYFSNCMMYFLKISWIRTITRDCCLNLTHSYIIVYHLRRSVLVAVWKIGYINFFFKICICYIHCIPSIFMWEKPYLTVIVVKRGDLRICVQYSLFVWNILVKLLLFALNFELKNEPVKM